MPITSSPSLVTAAFQDFYTNYFPLSVSSPESEQNYLVSNVNNFYAPPDFTNTIVIS